MLIVAINLCYGTTYFFTGRCVLILSRKINFERSTLTNPVGLDGVLISPSANVMSP